MFHELVISLLSARHGIGAVSEVVTVLARVVVIGRGSIASVG
jgi:hypothetical protein